MQSNNNIRAGEFFKFTTTRPVAILMVVIGVFVFGLISYQQLPLNLMPDISYPSLTVRTEYAGTSPEEVETTISRPIEQELGVVDNLVSITSISKAGQSDIILEFNWDTDMNQATADLREKLDQVFLPEEVKRPLILRYDPSLDPILRLGLYGERSLFYLRYLADEDLKRKLETIEGVAAVKVKGGLEEEIRVELNEQQLTLIGINIQQVKNRLVQENINLAGGNLKEGQTEYLVRTLNEFREVNEIANLVIGTWNDKEIKIKDIGNVKRTNKEREIITRINGEESVEIEIYKEADANIVSVAKRVSDAVFGTPAQQAYVAALEARKKESDTEKETKSDEAKKQSQQGPGGENLEHKMMTSFIAYNLPDGVKIDKLSDQSVFIENAVNEVKSTAVIGGILAIIILFIFLRNFTATVIVGLSIPISVISTFAPMKIFGVSLNIMSLGGLALGIGMLVDNSIVVLESIARCREEGDDLVTATVRGVGEVGGAVFASTMTTIAVFFPIVFVEGVAGQVFGDMALTVVFSLLASLAVALFLIPMLSSRQTAQFIAGAQIGGFLKQNILSFEAQAHAESLYSRDKKPEFGNGISAGLKVLLSILSTMALNGLKLISALMLTLLKFLTLPLTIPVMPLFAFLRLIRVIKFKISEVIISYAENPDFFVIRYVKDVWPGYLVNKSLPTFYNDLKKIVSWFKEKRIVRILFSPLLLLIILIKYVFQIFTEVSFRFIHIFFTLIALFFKGFIIIFKLLFTVPIDLVLNGFNYVYGKLETVYPSLLMWALEHKMRLLSVTVGLFLFSVFIVGPNIGSELIPEVHQGEFNVDLTLPVGTPAERTDDQVKPIQEYIENLDGVRKVASVIGIDKKESTNTDEGEHTAKLTVSLTRASSVRVSEERIISEIRTYMNSISGVQAKISRPTLFSFKTPVEVELHGYNLQDLQQVSRALTEKMRQTPGLFDVKANIQRGNPEVQIIYNRPLLARYGLNVIDVASIIRNKVRGDVATEFKEEDRKIDILVRVRDEDKESIDNLRRLIINPGDSRPLPLEAVADIKVNEGPSEIRRIDQQRTAVVTANISGRDLGSISEDIYQILRSMDMPDDFTYDIAGQNKEMETSLNSLMLALGLAIFLVYIVMASQFESLIHPFIIIFTIPMALIGVLFFLYLFSIPASIVVFLGGIMLAGIVVNNAIVLVDYINHLRDRGMEKTEAIMLAGKVRLRPILMTTSTTVLGLLPMAVGMGDGAEIRTPMAITVIIGLITSTILTLLVIPTVYSVLDRKA